ncbi:ABC transporter substrate-binding protein [Bosea sp. 2KB_26]|uniref:ABC transporter substrate-binding protein n=1 Tax=Bosea sp. 2KB_26 TaxID=3237475 RepID=UPI003F921E01
MRSALAAALLFLPLQSVRAQDSVVFAGFGGQYQSSVRKALFDPAGAKLGVRVREESHSGLASVRVQVQSSKPGWDIVQLGEADCARGQNEGLFVLLDYSQIDTGGIAPQARGSSYIGSNYVSVVLAWQKDKYKAKPPQSWKDFWNPKEFPGRRAMHVYPQESIEIALLADGVDKDKLYPLDADRALASLAKIKPSIDVFWQSGAQAAQLLKDGEVDMMVIWGSRVASVLADGAPVEFTYDQALLGFGCFAIPKGAPNAAAAQRMIAQMVTPEIQANIPDLLPYYGPINERAFEVKTFSAEALAKANSSPQNKTRQGTIQPGWWAGNIAKVQERYQALIAK